jgi:hypothetical protein
MFNTKKIVIYNHEKFEKAERIVRYRRINWLLLKKTVLEVFKYFSNECKKAQFPYSFSVIEYCNNTNENTIEIKCVSHPATKLKKFNHVEGENPNVFESGGTLVVTQLYTGQILFTFYPLLTERLELNAKEIIISNLIEPHKLNRQYLGKILNKFMLMIRYTSLHGVESMSLVEKLYVLKIFIFDHRNISKIKSSILNMKSEWIKLFLPYIIALVATYLGFEIGNA